MLSTLTWSRNHDASSGGAGNFLNGGNTGPQNPYDMASEYSLANVDTPLRWSSGFTLELPFGQGKKFLSNGKALDYAVGGWSFNAIGVYHPASRCRSRRAPITTRCLATPASGRAPPEHRR